MHLAEVFHMKLNKKIHKSFIEFSAITSNHQFISSLQVANDCWHFVFVFTVFTHGAHTCTQKTNKKNLKWWSADGAGFWVRRRYRGASPHTLHGTQIHAPKHLSPVIICLKVIIYSLSQKPAPPPTLCTPAGTESTRGACQMGGTSHFFWNKFRCRRREVIVSHLLPDTVGVLVFFF